MLRVNRMIIPETRKIIREIESKLPEDELMLREYKKMGQKRMHIKNPALAMQERDSGML